MMYQILLSIYEYGVKILDKTTKHVCSSNTPTVFYVLRQLAFVASEKTRNIQHTARLPLDLLL